MGPFSDTARAASGAGWHGGIRLQTVLELGRAMVLTASSGRTGFTSGLPTAYESGLSLVVRPAVKWTVKGDVGYFSGEGFFTSEDNTRALIGLGLGYRLN